MVLGCLGVVAYVEIRAENEYRNEGVKAELETHGAKVEKNFTKKVGAICKNFLSICKLP